MEPLTVDTENASGLVRDVACIICAKDEERSIKNVVEGARQLVGDVLGFFLRVEDFEASYDRMVAAGVEFVTQPRLEPYGRLAVFVDIAGNKWDLLGGV